MVTYLADEMLIVRNSSETGYIAFIGYKATAQTLKLSNGPQAPPRENKIK